MKIIEKEMKVKAAWLLLCIESLAVPSLSWKGEKKEEEEEEGKKKGEFPACLLWGKSSPAEKENWEKGKDLWPESGRGHTTSIKLDTPRRYPSTLLVKSSDFPS